MKPKKRLLARVESPTEFREENNTFLVFDNVVGSTLKAVYENMFDGDGLFLEKQMTT